MASRMDRVMRVGVGTEWEKRNKMEDKRVHV